MIPFPSSAPYFRAQDFNLFSCSFPEQHPFSDATNDFITHPQNYEWVNLGHIDTIERPRPAGLIFYSAGRQVTLVAGHLARRAIRNWHSPLSSDSDGKLGFYSLPVIGERLLSCLVPQL